MKAARKNAIIHDINAFNMPQKHIDYLVEIFEMNIKKVASIGARSASFLTDDIAIALAWGVTGYELKIELLTECEQPLWIGHFFSTNEPNKELKIMGSLE